MIFLLIYEPYGRLNFPGKPPHQLLRKKDIYKNKNCAKPHEGACKQSGIFYTQNALTDNQRINRQTNQTCDAGRNVAAVNAYLNQMNEKVKVATKKSSQPDIPEKIAVYKICEGRNCNAQNEFFINSKGKAFCRKVLVAAEDKRETLLEFCLVLSQKKLKAYNFFHVMKHKDNRKKPDIFFHRNLHLIIINRPFDRLRDRKC